MKHVRIITAVSVTLVSLIALLSIGALAQSEQMTTISDPPEHNIRTFDVATKTGLNGVMTQYVLTQKARTAGTSPESIYVTFDQEVELVGVLVSVDISTDIHMAEVAAGINAERGYSRDPSANWLIHTSFYGREGGKIDEHVWFPQGITVSPEDHVAIGGWLVNEEDYDSGISPEVIIYYQGVETSSTGESNETTDESDSGGGSSSPTPSPTSPAGSTPTPEPPTPTPPTDPTPTNSEMPTSTATTTAASSFTLSSECE